MRSTRSIGSPLMDTGKLLRAFLKDPLLYKKKIKEGRVKQRKQLQTMMGPLTGHCLLREYLHKLVLVGSPEYDRCQQPHMFLVTVRLWLH